MAAIDEQKFPEVHPILVLHRRPNYKFSFFPRIKAIYTVLDPLVSSDPLLEPLSKSVRVMLCVARTPITDYDLDRYPALECVVGSSAGVDHIDLAACRRRGIRVTSTGDAFSDDVADYAVGLLIDVSRRISAADRFVRAGSWPVKDYPLGSKISGKRVGIVGMGSIGSRVARRLEAFGCIIAYTSRKMKLSLPYPFYANTCELASKSDVLILCCASTSETYHIVDEDVLKELGKTGIIVNVGRGELIDEKELVNFLVRGEIGGAGLDVFENEPRVPQELLTLDNVVLSPHKAVLTPDSFAAIEELIVGNLEAFFANKPLRALVEVK